MDTKVYKIEIIEKDNEKNYDSRFSFELQVPLDDERLTLMVDAVNSILLGKKPTW